MSKLHPEFARLAAARKIVAASTDSGTLAQDRANAERWIAGFTQPGSSEVAVQVNEFGRRLQPACHEPGQPRVFYIHGGGLVYYSTEVFQPLLSHWADRQGVLIEAFDYPKAPEHSVELAVAQLIVAIEQRLEESEGPVLLAGDSVGGLLALYLSTRVFPQRFAGLTLIYPVLDLHTERDSYPQYGSGYFLDREAMRRFKQFLQPFFAERRFDPFRFSREEQAQLPECSVYSAGCDVLGDEGQAWAQQFGQRHQHFAELPHDFCLYFGKLASARAAVDAIGESFQLPVCASA